MATYSNLGITLITTGDESGTWGTTTNSNFENILDEAIAGAVTHNISSDADFTLTVVDATSSDARHAVIKFTSTTLSATRTCTFAPDTLQKTWVVINATTGGQSLTFKQGSAGATVTVPNGESAIIYSDGAGATNGAITRVLDSFTNTKITTGTLNATTLDLTNLEVTNIKAKDGTAALTIADSTGKVTVSSELAVDNLNLSGNAITSTDSNGNIDLTPNGTGEVNITKVDIDSGAIDGTTIGANSAAAGTFTTLTATTLGGALNANSQAITNVNIDSGAIDGVTLGTNSPVTNAQIDNININGNAITSTDVNGNIDLTPNGTGEVNITKVDIDGGTIDNVTIGGSTSAAGTFTTLTATTGNITTVNATTVDATNVEVTNVKAKDGTAAIAIADSTGAVTVSTPTVVSVNSSSDALRITQVGAGNAIVVEDSANPDASPFVVDANGRVLAGQSVGYATFGDFLNTARNPQIQYSGTTTPSAMMSIANWSNLASSPATLNLAKSRGAAVGSQAVVLNGDDIGVLEFSADDGTNFVPAAAILAEVDGTPGTNDMPGRLVFSTTADGASTPTERMRIWNQGSVGIGTPGDATIGLRVGKVVTGATSAVQIQALGAIQSDVTANVSYFTTNASTQATSFTLTNLNHFSAGQGTIGAGSTVTNQFGFRAESSLTGATNNYGFYSNIASGTNRWNFYAAGTADNFFGGPTTISVNSSSNALRITQVGSGNALLVEDSANPDASPFVIDADGRALIGSGTSYAVANATGLLQVTGTTNAHGSISRFTANNASPTFNFGKSRGTSPSSLGVVSSGDGLGTFNFSGDDGAAFIPAASISAAVDGTPGTNDMPGRLVFSTTADGASSPTERMRLTSAGNLLIGATSTGGAGVKNAVSLTGNAGSVFGFSSEGQLQPDVVTTRYFHTQASTAGNGGTPYTITSLIHYNTASSAFNADSTVTNQYGFFAGSSLTGATNNYGFYSNIASGTNRWNFYANGTAQNYFSGDTLIGTTTNTNSSKLVASGTISETVSSTQYLVASQYDIGTDPNEIPLNQYLGALAYVDSEWVAPQVGSGITGGTGTICKTSFAVEGGVKKMQVLIDLTGLNSGGTAGDIIGVNGTANPCYIAQIPSTFTILGGRMTCLETPAGGDTDIDLYSATEGTGVEDQAITALTETQIINAGTQSAGTVTYFAADPAANTYFYLVGQSTSNATYTAGRFLIEVFGA